MKKPFCELKKKKVYLNKHNTTKVAHIHPEFGGLAKLF
jgi:hypothetical protein